MKQHIQAIHFTRMRQTFRGFLFNFYFLWMFTQVTVFWLLTCMFRKLLIEFIAVPILRDVSNKETVIVKRYCHTKLFSLPQLIIIQLKICIKMADWSLYWISWDLVAKIRLLVNQHTSSPSLILSQLFIDAGAGGERVVCRRVLSLILILRIHNMIKFYILTNSHGHDIHIYIWMKATPTVMLGPKF